MDQKNWNTFGHDAIRHLLGLQLSSGRFSHAYLFAGPEGVGKKTLALEFAARVLGGEFPPKNVLNHPDFSLLDPEGNHTLEDVQQFMAGLSHKPFAGKYKVALINNAERLNTQSSNALLKTLEEPSGSTIIMLIASQANVLPTIVSRCQVFNFCECTKAQLEEFARREKKPVSAMMLENSFGRIGRLKLLLEGNAADTESEIAELKQLQRLSRAERLLQISVLADQEENLLAEKLHTWALWQTWQLHEEPDRYAAVRAISEALAGLRKNQNKKLILQQLLLKLERR